MNVRELSSEEIEHCKSINNSVFTIQLNKRRDYLQTLVINHLAQTKYLLINCFTSFGKSYCVKQGIRRLNIKYGKEQQHIIVVPSTNLKEEFEKVLAEFSNVKVVIINTFVKGSYSSVKSLWVDECHTALNPHSLEFSKAFSLVECPIKVGLSATLNKEQLEFAEKLGFLNRFYIPLHIGLQLKLVPPYNIYNLAVDLTESEKAKYVKIDNDYKDYIHFFSKFSEKSTAYLIPMLTQGQKSVKWEGKFYTGNQLASMVASKMELPTGSIIGSALKWMKQVNARKNLLYNAANKFKILEELLSAFEDRNTVVFTSSQKKANEIARISKYRAAYHGGNSHPQILKDFANGNLKVITTCIKLQSGQITDNVSVAIQTFFTSQVRALQQINGRILRFDENVENKTGILINLYVNDFEYQGEQYYSQDKVWLARSLVGSKFITYIESIEEIEELYEN